MLCLALLLFLVRVGGVLVARRVLPGAMSGFALMLPEWTAGVALFGLLALA